MSIPFFKATLTGEEEKYIRQVLANENSFPKKKFIARCEKWFAENHGIKNFFLTKSCTHALELAALVLDIKPDDEVILPSYAFVACANAFVLRGAKCVFVDVYPDCMTIDDAKIEAGITPKTKAIIVLNYGGVSCNYQTIRKIADKHQLYIVEDNAHGTGAKYNGKFLGAFGDISTFSFDHLKNITCGQGGGIAINNETLLEKFFIQYEFGTNRRAYFKGESDKYEWIDIGSNYPLSELNAAMLYAQLENTEKINSRFLQLWNNYRTELKEIEKQGKIVLPSPSSSAQHNGHCFFIKTANQEERTSLIQFLLNRGIHAQFHYTPLHTSAFGKKNGRFSGHDVYTTEESQRILRLPLFYGMPNDELARVVQVGGEFYGM